MMEKRCDARLVTRGRPDDRHFASPLEVGLHELKIFSVRKGYALQVRTSKP